MELLGARAKVAKEIVCLYTGKMQKAYTTADAQWHNSWPPQPLEFSKVLDFV